MQTSAMKVLKNKALLFSSMSPTPPSFCLIAQRSYNSQNTLTGAYNTAQNHQLRVMSTPEWPVPYYQRAFRHPAALDKYNGCITYIAAPLDDNHVLFGKEVLKDLGPRENQQYGLCVLYRPR